MTHFRRAQASDASTLAELAYAAYAPYVQRIGRAPAPMEQDYAEVVRSAEVWLAETGRQVLGMLELVFDGDGLLLNNLAVRPDAQSTGIGSRLLALAEREARRRGAQEIQLYTNEAMSENLAFYPRKGFIETHRGEHEGYRRVFFRKPVFAGIEGLVRIFYTALWNSWDDTLVGAVLAEDFRFRGSLGTQTSGRDGWRGYRDAIRSGVPDFHNELVELVADGDRAAARLSYTGTHRGPLAGIPATGRRFEYSGAAFFTSSQGKLESAWVLGDLEGLRRQLSADH